MLDSRSFRDFKGALTLKSSLDEASRYKGAVESAKVNLGGSKVGNAIDGSLFPAMTSGNNAFAAKILPKNSRLTLPSNTEIGSAVTYAGNGQNAYGIVVETKEIRGGKSWFIQPTDESWWINWTKNHPAVKPIVLTDKDILTVAELKKFRPARKLTKLERILEMVVGWWIPDLDNEQSLIEVVIRFIAGVVLIICVMYWLAVYVFKINS